MKRTITMMILMLVVGFTTVVSAYAETVQGQLKEIGPQSDYVKVGRTDPQSGKAEEIQIAIDNSTQLSGANSLGELKVGQAVTVDADHNFMTRQWKAKMITTSGSMAGL